MTERNETEGTPVPDAVQDRGAAPGRRSRRSRPRPRTLRRAVEEALARRAGKSAAAGDGYAAVAEALVRQAVEGDLKAAKLLLEILEGGDAPGEGEPVQVILDV